MGTGEGRSGEWCLYIEVCVSQMRFPGHHDHSTPTHTVNPPSCLHSLYRPHIPRWIVQSQILQSKLTQKKDWWIEENIYSQAAVTYTFSILHHHHHRHLQRKTCLLDPTKTSPNLIILLCVLAHSLSTARIGNTPLP